MGMARSADIQNDINHLQTDLKGYSQKVQEYDAQIRHLTDEANQIRKHVADTNGQIKRKQSDLQVEMKIEAQEQRNFAAQARAA
jgi:peptidoglycan hydrolase CwlO-like protein